jgi:HK97 family phage prohead protease
MKNITKEIADSIKGVFDSAEFKAVVEATEKAADATSGTFEVVITTENLDRYNEVIKLDGWELEHYMKNPVVLWGHDHHLLPIGVCTSISVVDGKMIAKGKFATHEHAQEIRKLYDLGIVKATSVGFIEKEREGNLITKAELIEFSFVSVPANPYALSLAMKEALSINDLVTRGIFDIQTKDAEPEEDEEEEETPAEPVVEEKDFKTKAVRPIIDSLKAALIALEALDVEEPERKEDEPIVADETAEEKQYREFMEGKKTLQDAATLLGDVLATVRQAQITK